MTKSIFHRCLALMLSALVAFSSTAAGAVSEFSRAWKSPNSSIVLDAYEYTVIDWSKIKNNKRLAGFINKATDGLQPRSNCKRNTVCRLRWRRYAAAKELYHTRKTLAKTLGLKWGAYHLGRPGNPIKQARHFLAFARPGPDDLVAIDIEENDPKRWMSLKEAEIFSHYIFEKLGRYPVLYTNHSTAKYIARNRAEYPLLSRLNLWYARYRASMRGAFPMGNWDSYTIWQFSAHTNCSPQSCLWRINGTDHWIDVNVVNMSVAELRQKWPFNDLTARQPGPRRDKRVPQLVAEALKAKPEATLTGYAKQPKVISAAKMFEALLSKPRMGLRGKAPLPSWRPGTVIVAKTLEPKEQMIKQPAVIAPKASAVEIAALEPKKPAVAIKPKLETSELDRQKHEMSPPVSKTPVVAAKIPQGVQPKTEAAAEVKVVAKSLVAQINSRNTQRVNA
ncbi:MAG: glycoside hydrolase family 25 protein, partial [Pseudomonadota bacterium]